MLTRVDVLSENPFYMDIRGARPTDSIIVDKIDGLDPPDIELFMGDYARDGASYHGRRVPPRNITFTLLLNPDYRKNESVSGLRRMLYKAFFDPSPQSDDVRVVLHDDELADRYLTGHTESFEGDLFSDDTTVQIAMRCQNPYILDVDATSINASGPTVPFTYEGSAEAGMEVTAVLTTVANYLTFDLNGERVVLAHSFQVGDQVYLNTIPGQRKVTLTRENVTTNILFALDWSKSKWIFIHSPVNTFRVYGLASNTVVANVTNITFRSHHWGV